MTDIEREISLARSEGADNDKNLPFFLEAEPSSGRGVLLIHGFTATPQEMRPLAEHLHQRGDTIFAIRLPGHGTSAADLAGRNYEEWLSAVDRGYQVLADRGLPVTGIGQSTGALLLLKLGLTRPFDAMILLSPFLRLRHLLAPFAGILHHWLPYHKRPLSQEEQPFYYLKRPLKGVHQINRLRRQVRSTLPRITTPALVLAAEGDKTIATGTANDLFHRLGSPHKELHVFGLEVPHVLTTSGNPCQQETFTLIDNFLSNLPQNKNRSGAPTTD